MTKTKLQQFFIDVFGEDPQTKDEIETYLKRSILTQSYIENHLEYFDEEILMKYETYLVAQFGDEFFQKCLNHTKL